MEKEKKSIGARQSKTMHELESNQQLRVNECPGNLPLDRAGWHGAVINKKNTTTIFSMNQKDKFRGKGALTETN